MGYRKVVVPLSFILLFNSCIKEKIEPSYNDYPPEVGRIIMSNCAVPGCHDDKSKDAAGGLSLNSWDKMFSGTKNGAVVIPFRHDFSTLFFYTNTYKDMGVTLFPTMPINKPPLSREEVMILRDWINKGAPSNGGAVKFSGDAGRKKFYVTNQGCDEVTVFDQATGLPMRYIHVGNTANIESPHMVKVAPDGKHWYVIFLGGRILQKYRTADDALVGNIDLGNFGGWNTFAISADSKRAFCVDFNNGRIVNLDLENLKIVKVFGGYNYPHGIDINQTGNTLYVTAQNESTIYKIDISDPMDPQFNEIILDKTKKLEPHEVMLSPDGQKYFVTCQKSNELRVMQTSDDSLLEIIPLGGYPQEMSFSKSTHYLFVSCMDDTLTFPGVRGSVAVINYENNTFIKKINTGFQPHGLAVDDDKKQVYVANRNADPDGPAPHHSTACGGRNGYMSFIDLVTLTVIPNKRIEVANDPYSVAVRP